MDAVIVVLSVIAEEIPRMDYKQIDQELERLEANLAHLKRDYEIYFSGGSKLPPYESHKKVEKAVRDFSRVTTMNFAQRFRYNNLTARFNSFADLWNKQMRYREEGRTPSGAVLIGSEKPRVTTGSDEKETTNQKMQRVYNEYLKSRRETGEGAGNLDFEHFVSQLERQKKSILEKYHCRDVDFAVSVEGGRAKVKARIVK